MVTSDSILPPSDPRLQSAASPVAPAPTGTPRSNTERTGQSTPAFEALLERLEGQARELQSGSKKIDGPGQLRDAVVEAETSLDDALALGDQLLEAYRESMARADMETNG